MSFPTKKAVAASMLLLANGEKAFAPAGPAATMPRVHVPAASPAVAPVHAMPQEAVTPMQPVVEERSSTVEMVSNMLMYSGMAAVAAGAGMALRSNTTSGAAQSQREMELSEALVVDAELGLASRTVAP